MSYALSVIIPTLNEAENLPALLNDLAAQQKIDFEILIADGGSTDSTIDIAESREITVITSPPGRGLQLNTAAARAGGEYLLFLHADSRLRSGHMLSDALKYLQIADGDRHMTAGHFPLDFARQDKAHEVTFRYMEGKSRLNRRHCQNGDQGLMLHREFFKNLGGFDESLPFFEDFRIADQIHNQGQWITLPDRLLTSARRFETEGLWPRYLLMGLIVTAENASIPEFVRQAPKVYESHDNSGRLLLTPYFRCLAAIARQRGLRGTWGALMDIGHLSRLHWWQTFFYFDMLFKFQSRPILRFYDRFVFPLLANRAGDAISACCAWILGMWILRPFFRIIEHSALAKIKKDSSA